MRGHITTPAKHIGAGSGTRSYRRHCATQRHSTHTQNKKGRLCDSCYLCKVPCKKLILDYDDMSADWRGIS